MMDLMYFGSEYEEKSSEFEKDFIKEVSEILPNVKLIDAYDEIKGHRQEVHLEETDKDNYFSFLIGKGWFEMSLTMGIALRDKSEKENTDRWISLAKKQYPEAFKPETVAES